MVTATCPDRLAIDLLRESPLPFLRSLIVDEDEDCVTISGRVDRFYYKQMAQESIMPVLGKRRLRNLIEVIASCG